MAHYRGRDNLSRRRKRRRRQQRIWEQAHCSTCGCSIRNEPHSYRINPRTWSISQRQCTRCADREAFLSYSLSGLLTNKLTMAATMARFYYEEAETKSRWKMPSLGSDEYQAICASCDRIHVKVKDFERDVWFNGGLQEAVVSRSDRGLSGKGNGWDVLVWTAAGRTLITLRAENSHEFITLITAEDEEPYARRDCGNEDMGPMGVQGYGCTEETATRLLEAAIGNFPEVQPDENVHYA